MILLPVTLVAAPVSGFPSNGGIPRFFSVADRLYRGGQPDKNGFEFLKEKGIKTIINLRMENDEADVVRKLGMNYVHIPMDLTGPAATIPESGIKKYFEILSNPENYPVFFHCQRGADRTGAMAAFYRIAVQGWDAKKAYDEARGIGMRWWYPAVKGQVYGFKPLAAFAAAAKLVLQTQ